MVKILITNGLLRKSLAVTRSLGQKGVEVYAAEQSSANLSAWSRYATKRLTYPNPLESPEKFFGWCMEVIQREHIDVFLPCDDDTMDAIVPLKDKMQPFVHLLVPDFDSYQVARDKSQAIVVAEASGLLTPKTWTPTSITELTEIIDELPYPTVIRPVQASGSRGLQVVDDPASLLASYERFFQAGIKVMIQECLEPGERIDVGMIYDRQGQLKASFIQKELRHFPHPFGPSTAQESIFDEELSAQCDRMLKHLHWRGVAEVEFMRDARTGRLYFMEINPRLWNSLYLAVLSGVDFPWLIYNLAMDKEIAPVRTYRNGVKCRSLFPADILHFLTVRDKDGDFPSLFAGGEIAGYDDIFAWDDLGPFLGFLWASLRFAFSGKVILDYFRRNLGV